MARSTGVYENTSEGGESVQTYPRRGPSPGVMTKIHELIVSVAAENFKKIHAWG